MVVMQAQTASLQKRCADAERDLALHVATIKRGQFKEVSVAKEFVDLKQVLIPALVPSTLLCSAHVIMKL
jgi:hypothetical protein